MIFSSMHLHQIQPTSGSISGTPMAVSGWLSMAKLSLFYMFYKGNNNIFVVQEFKSKFKILNLN